MSFFTHNPLIKKEKSKEKRAPKQSHQTNPTMKFISYVLFLPATLWLIGATAIDGPTDDEVNVTYYGDDYPTAEEESGNATSDWWDDLSNVVVEGVSDADVREDNSLSTELDCWSGLRKFDPNLQKKVYRVGVHANRGVETAWEEYNRTFSTYLSVTAGRRFVPPIEFQMVPVSYKVSLADDVNQCLLHT